MAANPGKRDAFVERFVQSHDLPAAFADLAATYFYPLADWIAGQTCRARVLGINGAQGTGKTTLARFLEGVLTNEQGWKVVRLSIDDLYLTHAQRQALARDIHPLLATRGPPGTHDVAMGRALLDRLAALSSSERLAIPRFDKAADNPEPRADWPSVSGPVDLVLFEGWCVGTPAQSEEALREPVNRLEAEEDPDGTWRRTVNRRLATDYQRLFGKLDRLVLLAAPSFDCVYEWRLHQEKQLAASHKKAGTAVMSAEQVKRFIQFYERLTRVALEALPGRADITFQLDAGHGICSARFGESRGQDPAFPQPRPGRGLTPPAAFGDEAG